MTVYDSLPTHTGCSHATSRPRFQHYTERLDEDVEEVEITGASSPASAPLRGRGIFSSDS